MNNNTIYLLPGLAFDHRIFRNLDFGNLPVHHLDWIEPEGDEPLAQYALQMAAGREKRPLPQKSSSGIRSVTT